MAKATLPVNFKDDILNAGMDGKRKFTITQNTDGTYSIEDVTEYDQIGSNFGSAQINATNTAVNASADASKIIDDLATVAANTQKGYMAGALALKEVNQSLGNLTKSTNCVTQKASTGVRYLSSDSGWQVTNEAHNVFTNLKALDFITDTASLNNLTASSYATLYSVVGIITVNYGKNCNRGLIICNSVLTTKISANKWTTVATLPSGYRPCVSTPFQCHYGTILVIGQILTNGIVQVYSSVELSVNSQALAINAEYII